MIGSTWILVVEAQEGHLRSRPSSPMYIGPQDGASGSRLSAHRSFTGPTDHAQDVERIQQAL